jgi:hypothetical protein
VHSARLRAGQWLKQLGCRLCCQPYVLTQLSCRAQAKWDWALDHEQIVFARVSPAHKLLIVENCQRRGEQAPQMRATTALHVARTQLAPLFLVFV